MDTKENLFLVGFVAAGKTTCAPILAQLLGKPYADLDEEVLRFTGRSPARIFSEDGQDALRSLERDLFSTLAEARASSVLALGAGAVSRSNASRFHRICWEGFVSLYMDALVAPPARNASTLSLQSHVVVELGRVYKPDEATVCPTWTTVCRSYNSIAVHFVRRRRSVRLYFKTNVYGTPLNLMSPWKSS